MSIEDIEKKINPIYIIIIIFLAGALGIGIIKILPVSTPEIIISQANQIGNVLASETSINVVASKNSKIYHLLTCPGAKTIKPENKVFFASSKLAEQAGLRPAKNCKELFQIKK